MRICLALAAVAFCAVAAAETYDAVIWTSERTIDDARAKLTTVKTSLENAGFSFAPGWPTAVQSDTIEGLKPGWGVVLVGYCKDSSTVLAMAKSVGKLSYARKVELNAEQAAAAECPVVRADEAVLPRVALVLETANNRLALEKRIDGFRPAYPDRIAMPPGYPQIVDMATVTKGKKDKFGIVLGVCPASIAEIIKNDIAYQLVLTPTTATLVCPELSDQGTKDHLSELTRSEHSAWLNTRMQKSPAVAASVLTYAVSENNSELFERALAAKPSPLGEALATAWLSRASANAAPESGFAGKLLAAGARLDSVQADLCRSLAKKAGLAALARAVELGLPLATCAKDLSASGLGADRWRFLLQHGVVPGGSSLAWAISAGDAESSTAIARALSVLPTTVPNENDDVISLAKPDEKAVAALRAALAAKAPAMLAAYDGDIAGLKKATDFKSPVLGWTPLLVAIKRGHEAAALDLLGRAELVTPGAQGSRAKTPLYIAVESASANVVRAVAEKAGKAALAEPSNVCCLEESYLPPGILYRPSSTTPSYSAKKAKLFPMHAAAIRGALESVKLLLELGAQVDATDGSGFGLTPTMLAADRDDLPMLQALLAAGAQPEAVDKKGAGLLAHAINGNATKVQTALLAKKPFGSFKGALSAAAASRSLELVKKLIQLGAAKGGEGRRAADTACVGNDDYEEMWSFLCNKFGSRAREWRGVAGTGEFCVQEGD